ncbi:DNA cytosine methyltransferase [Limimaricola soesokkakensis]|uniref:DNA cytosine methyltransferase n=1 Tax=Limimaricola soesokkakensis TaxID=1343159 RepID=UPI00351860C2
MKRPIGIDLFAGAGGMSLGFEQAGFDVVAAVEIDPVHCAVHEYNFPRTAILARTVEGLSADEVRKTAGIGDREVDCVFGGAPCQGFSLIGQRILDDPRNKLALDFVRLVKDLDARTFVFENVKGLTVGRHKKFLTELVQAFEEAGYDVQLPWQVLNAAHYGTPQFRERLILFGARKGEALPRYPAPKTNIAGRPPRFPELPPGPSCSDAIGDLPNADDYETLMRSDAVETTRFADPSDYAAAMRGLSNDSWHYGYVRDWQPALLTSSARTGHSEISQRRFKETEQGATEPISRFFKLPANGVANTLRAGTDGARGAFTSPRPIHYRYNRCITVREMARLHGFPDWFRFNATKWHGARQIGNAVPPPLARAIAGEVMAALGIVPSRPEEKISLGAPGLLQFSVSHAALHFGVEAPLNRRNQKSGATKRKQEDIERERLELLMQTAAE